MFYLTTLLSQELHKWPAVLNFLMFYATAALLVISKLRDQKLEFKSDMSIEVVTRVIAILLLGWLYFALGEWTAIYLILSVFLLVFLWCLLKILPEELWKQGSENNKGELLISVPLTVFFLILVAKILINYEG